MEMKLEKLSCQKVGDERVSIGELMVVVRLWLWLGRQWGILGGRCITSAPLPVRIWGGSGWMDGVLRMYSVLRTLCKCNPRNAIRHLNSGYVRRGQPTVQVDGIPGALIWCFFEYVGFINLS